MKKFISVISSLVIASGMTSVFTANAADESADYKPYFYFKADESSSYEVLKWGAIFVNRKGAGADSKIPVGVYFKDDEKIAGQIFAKWGCENKALQLTDLSGPVSVKGASPYKVAKSDADINLKTFTDLNVMAASYADTNVKTPMALTGETSDAYPLACFNVSFTSEATGGVYEIAMYNKGNYFTSVIPRYVDDITKTIEVFPAEYSKTLKISCSDRMLGDVNNDGKINAVDASMILAEYAKVSSNNPTSFSADQEVAADIDGNYKYDAVDASGVLAYYAYTATLSEGATPKSLNQFIKGE